MILSKNLNFDFNLLTSKNNKKNIKKNGKAGILYLTKLPIMGVTIPMIVISANEYIKKKYPIFLKLLVFPNTIHIIMNPKNIIFSIAFGKTARE